MSDTLTDDTLLEDMPLLVFAVSQETPTLRELLVILLSAGFPVSLGTEAAGEADDEALDNPEWEAAFVRWNEPEMHEVALLERMVCAEDEEGLKQVTDAMNRILASSDQAGKLIVGAHLQQTQVVYALQLLDALFTDEDHPAWGAFDVLLRTLADITDGMIYAESEGYLDAEGELLLSEEDTAEEVTEDISED